MIRTLLAIVIGAAIAVALVSLIEYLGHQVYPVPLDLDIEDPVAMAEFVKSQPYMAFAFEIAAWAIGALVGGWAAAKIAAKKPYLFAGIIGALVLLGGVISLITIPHPLWFSITAVGLVALMAFMAGRLGSR